MDLFNVVTVSWSMVLEGMGLAMLPIYDTKKFMISEREGRGPG